MSYHTLFQQTPYCSTRVWAFKSWEFPPKMEFGWVSTMPFEAVSWGTVVTFHFGEKSSPDAWRELVRYTIIGRNERHFCVYVAFLSFVIVHFIGHYSQSTRSHQSGVANQWDDNGIRSHERDWWCQGPLSGCWSMYFARCCVCGRLFPFVSTHQHHTTSYVMERVHHCRYSGLSCLIIAHLFVP